MGTSTKFKGRIEKTSPPYDSSVFTSMNLDVNIPEQLVTWTQMKSNFTSFINSGAFNKLAKSVAIYILRNGGAQAIINKCYPGMSVFLDIVFAINGIKTNGNGYLIKAINIADKTIKVISFIEKVIEWLDHGSFSKDDSLNKVVIHNSLKQWFSEFDMNSPVEDILGALESSSNTMVQEFFSQQIYTFFLNEIEYKFEETSKPIEDIMNRRKIIKDYINNCVHKIILDNSIGSISKIDEEWVKRIYKEISKSLVSMYENNM